VLVLDDDVVTETVIVSDGNNLSVSGCNYRVAGTPRTEIETFVNVPLLLDRMNCLSEFHGNVTDTVFDRPYIWNVCKKGILVFKHFTDLFKRLNRAFEIRSCLP
jgi:hypothetical protein